VTHASAAQKVIVSGDLRIPAKIYSEPRLNVRFSITRKGAILRLPIGLTAIELERQSTQFEQWVVQQVTSQEELRVAFAHRSYQSGQQLTVGNRQYQLVLEDAAGAVTCSATRHGGTIVLRLVQNIDAARRSKVVRHLLSRVVARDFASEVTRRVHELNAMHFKCKIGKVSLKYNHSNWGSCSSRGNINLSTCLLFAPAPVIDYVIIHELAHLLEMNHSSRFWEHVSGAMPDYREQERWLKENWHTCDF
jgi:hypothetical protein